MGHSPDTARQLSKFFPRGQMHFFFRSKTSYSAASALRMERAKWGWDWKTGSTEDEVNLLYVAVTRAKLTLAIPTQGDASKKSFAKLLMLLHAIRECSISEVPWAEGDIIAFSKTLVDGLESEAHEKEIVNNLVRAKDIYEQLWPLPQSEECPRCWNCQKLKVLMSLA